MKRFKKIDDEYLIDLIHQGNYLAMEDLLKRYNYYSWKLAYQFLNEHTNSGILIEELQQVAYSTVVPVLKAFTNDHHSFHPYWKVAANNEITRYYKENSYTVNAAVFAGISLNEDEYESDFSLSEKHGSIDMGITGILLKEEMQLMLEESLAKFKEKDANIVNLFIDGKSFENIQAETGETIRHIYYVVDRFQKLFSAQLKKRNYN
ncbi:MAG: hypothetical protein K6F07_01310 [Bacilli bacterium]|nr:hypothetical protein [Bacilli bacterium]